MKLNIKTPLSFQKKILFLVALGSFCLISYFLFFFDAHLTSFLQSHFNAHGPTEVHIKGLKTNLFLSRLRIESLSFRDLYENKKRKVKLTGLEGDFELLSLLQKKTIIENLFIKDVFFEKEGPQNASLSKAPLSPMRQRAQEKSHKTRGYDMLHSSSMLLAAQMFCTLVIFV